MDSQVSLEQAVQTLVARFGTQYVAGFEDGKADMAKELEKQLGLSASDAKTTVEALVAAHTIRWRSQPEALPNQEGTMGMFVEEAMWNLGGE